MNILCITHADFETPGVIEAWARDHGHSFKTATPYKTPDKNILVDESCDFLIVMGGPQSPLEIEKDPYLKYEIALIKNAIKENKPVLGFCLGAQLIGEALGATTARSPEKEVGVFPITLTDDAQDDPVFHDFPKSFPVIHWHNDMPGLTSESKLLAYSIGCPRQIIRYQSNVYGLQCHLEITREGIETMIQAVPDDLKPSRFTQTADELLSQDYHAINENMVKILERMAR